MRLLLFDHCDSPALLARYRLRHPVGVSLIRFWFEFDLDGHRPPAPGTGNLDGGTVQHQWLSWGAGVTARDEADALALLGDVVGAELPPRLKTIRDVAVDRTALGLPDFLTVGDPSRRGVWLPPENLHGLPRRR